MDGLPNETILYIVLFLSGKDLKRLRRDLRRQLNKLSSEASESSGMGTEYAPRTSSTLSML
jgi:hypothetical protein